MIICFTLDDVLRAKTAQILNMYKKYEDNDLDVDSLKIDTNDFQTILGFETKKEYFDFLYQDYFFEIFGEAKTTEKMVDKVFNNWHLNLLNNYGNDNEVIIANPFEFGNSIGSTFFFLSKIAPKVREYYFPSDSLTIYDKCDVLVTADPKLLDNAPEDKVVIKIETDYNKPFKADYTYKSLMDFLNDNDTLAYILGYKDNDVFEEITASDTDEDELLDSIFDAAEDMDVNNLENGIKAE